MAHTQLIALRHTLVVVVLCLLTGTASLHAQQWHTTIEITYPPELDLPAQVSEVLLVNNTVAHPDAPLGAFYTLMAASEMLEGSYYLPAVLETSQNESSSLYIRQLLSERQADSLLSTYNSEALIVLNQLIVHPSSECYQTDNETYYAYTRCVAASHWTLYYHNDSAGALATQTLVYADTLYWENEGETWNDAVQALPSADEARSEMCIYVGEHFAERLLPQVETYDRYLYDLGEDDPGMQYFSRRQWQQAVDAWSAPHKNKKLTAYAEANCAVAYELLGDLGAAYAAAGAALNAFESLRSADARQQAVNIRYYMEQLRARMAR
ncbi:MAG: hypothetical protein IJT12_01225 [Paludibacteraceae bacterium]|nr:hypothetical protein [Paludibacteraceae bacterium]